MRSMLLIAILMALCMMTASVGSAAIIVDAYYHLGEADPGATAGGAGNATTVDSSGNGLNLTANGSPTYSSDTAAPGSTLSINLTAANTYYTNSTVATSATDNFGIEGWFKLPSVVSNTSPQYNSTYYSLAYNGYPGNSTTPVPGTGSGFGLYATAGSSGNVDLQGLFGNIAFLDSGVAVTPNVWTYFAMVRQSGVTSLYINSTTPITPTNSTATPNAPQDLMHNPTTDLGIHIGASPTGGDLLGGYADEVRIFTFTPGQFSTSDLLIATVPEPSSLVLGGLSAIGLLVAACRQRRGKSPRQ